jgi:predicted CXXCH cytochrome family protein
MIRDIAVRIRPPLAVAISLGLLSTAPWFLGPALQAQTTDAPHNDTQSIMCISCHMTHHSPVGGKATQAGNPNLCHSCHTPGGMASRYTLVESDQAVTGPSLPTNVPAGGTSHRWDSGLAGHADYMGGARTNSSGSVLPSGDYTGRVAKTYVLTVVSGGQVGAAKFNWYGTPPGGGGASNVTAGSLVALDQGISVIFSNGTVNPSFQAGDRWNLYVRPDIGQPTNASLLGYIADGLLACSVCHNQHSQSNTPFDVTAPTNSGASGRHFQRIDNSACQLCADCHAARNVTAAAAGSHPVGVLIPAGGFFKSPTTNLPLEKATGKVRCLTCHDIHNSGSSDGSLLRIANRTALCTQCHTLADTNQAAHLSVASGVLWPGGQYGTTYPAETDAGQRGMCVNCHQPHGWPTNLTSGVDYTNLLVDAEESLCFTCHDGSPAAATNSVIDDFTNSLKVSHHPVVNSDPKRHAGRSVECTDCHNPHKARLGRSVYANTATSARNLIVNPNVGASGVAVNYSGLGNFVAPGAGHYSFTNSAVYEYQICFKCHSGYAWGTNAPTGLSPNGSVASPAETDVAQGFSPNNLSGHPIVTGLSNYVNAASPKGLTTARMKTPWNSGANIGRQTMLCTDCHNTDGSAAQGPHGSAAQFMLRGPNSDRWPDVAMADVSSSWCANCHNPVTNVHDSGKHDLRCYNCHIVIPHGGKMSRLIADNDGAMPSRYAFNNDKSAIMILQFKKASSYDGANQCNTTCGEHTFSGTGSEDW